MAPPSNFIKLIEAKMKNRIYAKREHSLYLLSRLLIGAEATLATTLMGRLILDWSVRRL